MGPVDSPRISVVVPVYNSEQYLPKVIESLQDQDYPADQYELIFVDNGSQDRSLDILGAASGIRVLQEAQPGPYAARNTAFREARGEIVAFTDSDCYPVKGWLSFIDRAMTEKNALVVLGPRVPVDASKSLRLLCQYENTKTQMVYDAEKGDLYYGYTNNMAIHRKALERIGPFIQRQRGSDTIFVRQLVEEVGCDRLIFDPDMTVRHAEMRDLKTYYDKVSTYASSRHAYRHIMPVRPLDMLERLRVYRQTIRDRSVFDSAWLLLLLTRGVFSWWWGRFRRSPEKT